MKPQIVQLVEVCNYFSEVLTYHFQLADDKTGKSHKLWRRKLSHIQTPEFHIDSDFGQYKQPLKLSSNHIARCKKWSRVVLSVQQWYVKNDVPQTQWYVLIVKRRGSSIEPWCTPNRVIWIQLVWISKWNPEWFKFMIYSCMLYTCLILFLHYFVQFIHINK